MLVLIGIGKMETVRSRINKLLPEDEQTENPISIIGKGLRIAVDKSNDNNKEMAGVFPTFVNKIRRDFKKQLINLFLSGFDIEHLFTGDASIEMMNRAMGMRAEGTTRSSMFMFWERIFSVWV